MDSIDLILKLAPLAAAIFAWPIRILFIRQEAIKVMMNIEARKSDKDLDDFKLLALQKFVTIEQQKESEKRFYNHVNKAEERMISHLIRIEKKLDA